MKMLLYSLLTLLVQTENTLYNMQAVTTRLGLAEAIVSIQMSDYINMSEW